MRITLRFGLPTLGMASALLLAACGSDSSGPGGGGTINNPQGLTTNVNGLVGTLTAGPLVGVGNVSNVGSDALGLLSRGHGSGLAAMIGARPTVVVRGHGVFKVPMLQRDPRFARPFGTDGHIVTQGDAIDDAYYGTVFDYNPSSGQYEDDGTGTGPVDGVRFILYDVVGGVIDPNTVVGTLDILDQSDLTKSQVGILVQNVGGTVTYADYSVALPDTFDPVAEAFDLLSSGGVSDGTDDVTFNLHMNQTGPDDQSVSLLLDGPNANLDFDFDFSFDPQNDNETLDIDIQLAGGGESLRLSGTQDYDGTLGTYATDLTLTANGGTFATATTDDGSGAPVWEKPNGDPLTTDEENLLGAIILSVVFAVLDVFGLVFFALLTVA